MVLSLFIVALPIVIADLKERKIPNIYLCFLSGPVLLSLLIYGFGDMRHLSIYLFLIFILQYAGMGMGDFKLLAIIGTCLSAFAYEDLHHLLTLVLALTFMHILWVTIRYRSVPVSIPMAPAIFLSLSLYLVTR